MKGKEGTMMPLPKMTKLLIFFESFISILIFDQTSSLQHPNLAWSYLIVARASE